jgi:hypothetical protein
MIAPYPRPTEQTEAYCREKLATAQLTYLADPNEFTKAAYTHALRSYADLVLRCGEPREPQTN